MIYRRNTAIILLEFTTYFPTGNRSDYILLRRIYLSIRGFSRAYSEAYNKLLAISY